MQRIDSHQHFWQLARGDCRWLRSDDPALPDWFSPARLMGGSDWPVLTLAASHGDWVAAGDALLQPLSDDERAQVLHGSARRFHGLA